MKQDDLPEFIFVGHGSYDAVHLQSKLLALKLPPCIILFEEPSKPPELNPETILEFSRALEVPAPFFPKETAHERSHPNQPFYRNLPRYRRRS